MKFGFALLTLLTLGFSSTTSHASLPEVIIVGEDHIDAISMSYKRRAVETASLGDSWLLLEGFYQSSRNKLERDLDRQGIENSSQIEGLESPVPYALGVMFKLHEDLSSLLATVLRPEMISPYTHQYLDDIRGGFARFFYENEAAWSSWKKFQETPSEVIGHDSEIDGIRNAINQRQNRTDVPIIRALIHQDSELLRRVFQFQNYVRKFAAFLAQDQARNEAGSRRESIIEFGRYFTQAGVGSGATQGVWLDWRNEVFAKKAIDSYPKAQAAGVPLVLIVGQLHVEGIKKILESELPRRTAIRTIDSRTAHEPISANF